MDQQQNYIIFLIAVFLALGIGILVGASMGENALVTNQIAVIEELKSEIRRHKEEVESQFLFAARLQEELLVWESLEKEYLNPLCVQDKLKNVQVKVIAQGNLPAALIDFLELSGCRYQTFVFASGEAWSGLPGGKDEEFLFLGPDPLALLQEMLALYLLGEESPGAIGILELLQQKNLLWIQQTASTVPASCSLPVAEQSGEGNGNGSGAGDGSRNGAGGGDGNGNREIFLAYGPLCPPCPALLQRIGAEGKTVLRINPPESGPEAAAEAGAAAAGDFTLNHFYGRLKLLDFLQAAS